MAASASPTGPGSTGSVADRLRADAAYQAFWLLRIGFVVAPVLFGLDKFAEVLTDWELYLAPRIDVLARLASVYDR